MCSSPKSTVPPAAAFPAALVALIAVSTIAVPACSQWSSATLEQTLLKPPRMSPDTVILEMALVDLPADHDLWQDVDELHVDVDARRKLNEHQIRVGVIGSQLPAWLLERVERQDRMFDIDEESKMAVIASGENQRRLQCRSGNPREIDMGSVREEMQNYLCEDQSAVLKDAQCKFSIVTKPMGDGRVEVKVTPEIHHGSPRHRWVGSEGSFRVDLRKDCESCDELTATVVLAPGQTLVLGTEAGADGLGSRFFELDEKYAGRSRCLLLRLAQTQFDDLFAPTPTFTPIATDGA
jgi:hypothetical protein